MPVLSRRRRRNASPPGVGARLRGSVAVDLPESPGSLHRPGRLVLPVPAGAVRWALPAGTEVARGLAAFLAVLDVAPPGAVLDAGAGLGEHALLAAVYSRRLVRAVEGEAELAHAARQAAATNALPVVVDQRRLGHAQEETLDGYSERTALEPVVVRVGPGADPAVLIRSGLALLRRRRPWLLATSAVLARLPELDALGYHDAGDGVLTPEPPAPAFARRVDAWAAALRAEPAGEQLAVRTAVKITVKPNGG
jgi:hypothetical protein